MKLTLKCCFGLFAGLAVTLLVGMGVRAQDTSGQGSTGNPAVTAPETVPAASQPSAAAAEAQTPSNLAEQSPEVKAAKASECESMGMHAMRGHRMQGPEMGGMGQMAMGPMGMGQLEMTGMPMLQEHMEMMRMISKDPKMAGHMLEMRADMMRAIADVMTKYGKQMESGEWQSSQTSSTDQ